jgi:hypothetical protein
MTPKEKAKELFDKMYNSGDLTTYAAKKCALKAVDLAIEYNDFHLEFLYEVKQELNNIIL